MMRQRIAFGAGFIVLLVVLLWADDALTRLAVPAALEGVFGSGLFPPGVVIFITCFGLSIQAAREMAAIFRAKGVTASSRLMCFAAGLGLLVSVLVPSDTPAIHAVAVVATAAGLVLVAALVFFSRHKSPEGVAAAAGGTLLSFVYLGLLFGFVLALRREHSVWTLLWVIALTKIYDSGAYFTGRALGRHKLIPWLSPGKTWEGLAGGVVAAGLAGAGGALALERWAGEPAIGAAAGAAAGLVFALVAQSGDLLESLLKRDAGRKDSGSALPGFGGVLDVLDSPLLVFPVAYWWLWWLKPG